MVAFAVLLTLALPFGGIALAGHGGDNTHTLNVDIETDSNPTGTAHTLTATLGGGGTCTNTCEVDFEIESGPPVRRGCTVGSGETCTGGTTTDSDNSPTTPDMTCTTTVTNGSCFVVFTSDTAGTNVIRAWVDDDRDNATFDADQTEGRDEATAAGSRTEPDDTDVVEKSWFAAIAANAAIDCDDESGDDTQVNPVGQAETYTCTTFNDNGTGTGGVAGNAVRDGSEPVISGLLVDLERAGANDPDNLGFAAATNTTADTNNACTTDANGTCTVVIGPDENESGSVNVCFWIDADSDAGFSQTDKYDGGECEEEAVGAENTSLVSDVVTKTWAQPAAATLDAEPEVDNNASGTSHTVTATVKDQFGNLLAGVPVDFNVTTSTRVPTNAGLKCDNVLTNASGVASCTYTDAGTTTSGGQDTITVSKDGSTDATEGRNETASPGGTAEPDLVDVVTKFWTVGGPPAASTVIVDMTPNDDCNDVNDSTDSQEVGNDNPICGVVRDSTGAAIPGKTVTLTYSGPGEFGSDTSTPPNGNLDAGEGRGRSITVTANETGRFDAILFSTATGTGTVTATADSASDTGTKTWTTPDAGARNIDCEPETATNPPGTSHVWGCTVTDRYGNPVPLVGVTPSESGPGRLENSNSVNTDASGRVEFVTSSTVNEEGDQTLTGQITADVIDVDGATDLDDACDQPQGTTLAAEPGTGGGTNKTPAPAGTCEDSVTKTWGEPEPEPEPEPLTRGACSGFAPGSRTARSSGGFVIVGTPGDDILDGSGGADLICGLGGNDIISGRGAGDLITGNGGDDNIKGGGGKDNISGNGGNDNISGSRGNDAIKGNAGNDTLKGNAGIDSLAGGKGADSLQGGDGNDILKGGPGNDTLRGGDGDDLLDGGDGNDGCFGNAGNDKVKNCE